jgi:hypothetical protein
MMFTGPGGAPTALLKAERPYYIPFLCTPGHHDKRDSLPLAEPAESHVTQSEQAKCRKCVNSEDDAFGDKEGKQVYHCLACSTYLHEDCMSPRERGTVWLHDYLEDRQHLASLPSEDLELERRGAIEQYYEEMQTERTTTSLPPWRCADCTTNQQFAMTRILDLSCTPTGKLMAVVEYMGYTAGELIPVERLIDPANALTDAFKAVLIPEADAHRTVHYVVTEIKRGETDIPSLMHYANHRELINQPGGNAAARLLPRVLYCFSTYAKRTLFSSTGPS